jgi:hypothetical protein
MIRLFIETVPQNVKELTAAVSAGNWERLKMAHKLKSTVDSMGIKSIRDDIAVESNVTTKDLAEIPNLVQKIEAVIHDCIEQLEQTTQLIKLCTERFSLLFQTIH